MNTELKKISQKEFDKIYNKKTNFLDSGKHSQGYIVRKCEDIKRQLNEMFFIIN